MSAGTWSRLGSVSLEELTEVGREMHWAAQAIDGVGRTLAAPEPNYEHVALRWQGSHDALATTPIGGRFRAALFMASAEVAILDDKGEVGDRIELSGRTLTQAVDWVRSRFESSAATRPEWTAVRDDLNPSPVGGGGPFRSATPAHRELADWYGNASSLFESLAREESGAAPVLCWPHHFDIATFINLDPDKAQYEGRSVNVGMSPGDGAYPQPYYYVVPYPGPDPAALPALPEPGRWHTEGWVGRVLTASHVIEAPPDSQASLVEACVRSALGASKELLGAGSPDS